MDECVCVWECVHLSGTFVCVHMVLKALSRNGIFNGNSHQLIAQFAQVMSAGIPYWIKWANRVEYSGVEQSGMQQKCGYIEKVYRNELKEWGN